MLLLSYRSKKMINPIRNCLNLKFMLFTADCFYFFLTWLLFYFSHTFAVISIFSGLISISQIHLLVHKDDRTQLFLFLSGALYLTVVFVEQVAFFPSTLPVQNHLSIYSPQMISFSFYYFCYLALDLV